MALQDILAAISAQADQQIQRARSEHHKQLTKMREQSERAIATKKQDIALQKEQRKAQLTAKAENHAAMYIRNAELSKKQELLDRTYDNVIAELSKLPDEDLKRLIESCLKGIKGKGAIHPAKKHESLLNKLADSSQLTIGESIDAKGGFKFISDTQEQDYTFEHLVSEVLRPKTELEISHLLFAPPA